MELNNVKMEPNNVNIDNIKNNNEQNNSTNESLEEKKSLQSLTQYICIKFRKS